MLSPPDSRIVELKLTMEKLVPATIKREEFGITFIGIKLLLRSDSITTDKLVVTDEAVRCMDERK